MARQLVWLSTVILIWFQTIQGAYSLPQFGSKSSQETPAAGTTAFRTQYPPHADRLLSPATQGVSVPSIFPR